VSELTDVLLRDWRGMGGVVRVEVSMRLFLDTPCNQ